MTGPAPRPERPSDARRRGLDASVTEGADIDLTYEQAQERLATARARPERPADPDQLLKAHAMMLRTIARPETKVGEALLAGANALEEVTRLRDLLARLEWAGDPNQGRDHCPVCPACGGYRPETEDEPGVGHKPGCQWVKLLRKAP